MNYPTRSEIEELSTDQRLQLIEDVWDTLGDSAESMELSEGHRDLLDGRLEQLEKNPNGTVSWTDALQRLRKAS
jgi:putative addiction module component (TIGR02574 family)